MVQEKAFPAFKKLWAKLFYYSWNITFYMSQPYSDFENATLLLN